jgi:hypothetical protein
MTDLFEIGPTKSRSAHDDDDDDTHTTLSTATSLSSSYFRLPSDTAIIIASRIKSKMSSNKIPMVAGTMQTDPRSGGVKRSSGVHVDDSVKDAWAGVRDDANTAVDWILIGYDGDSKTDMTLVEKGSGGLEAVSSRLQPGVPLFGGVKLQTKNRFVHFLYVDEDVPAMKKGRTLMYKNGVFNVLEGCDGEIEITPGLTEATMGPVR